MIRNFFDTGEVKEIFSKYRNIGDKIENYHSQQSMAKIVSVVTVPAGILATLVSNNMSVAMLSVVIEVVSLCFWKGVDPRSQTRDSVLEFYRKFNAKLRDKEKMKLIDVGSEILGVSTETSTVNIDVDKSVAIYREPLEDLDFSIEVLHINPMEAVFKDNNADRKVFRNEELNDSFELKYGDSLEDIRDSQEVMSTELEEIIYRLYDNFTEFDLRIDRDKAEMTYKSRDFAKMHSLPSRNEIENSLIIAESMNEIVKQLKMTTNGGTKK